MLLKDVIASAFKFVDNNLMSLYTLLQVLFGYLSLFSFDCYLMVNKDEYIINIINYSRYN